MSAESVVRALVSVEPPSEVMSVQAELDAVTVERDNLILERDGLLEKVSGLLDVLDERNSVISRQATDLAVARSYKSLPLDMVWQDYYSPNDVLKIRRPLDDEIERLTEENQRLRDALRSGAGWPL